MQTHFDPGSLTASYPNPVITLGNFDGVHLGHQEIFRRLCREASENQGTSVVVTFYPHPLKVLCPERAPLLITTLSERIERVEACGIDVLLSVPFTRAFSQWTPNRFIREILVDKLGAAKILVGEDFRFGQDRKGNLDSLRRAGKKYGFSVRRIQPVKVYGREASSTRVRYSVQKGMIREATAVLGRPFCFAGVVEEGDRRGRELGFPTANLHTEAELLPPHGVYAVWVTMGDRTLPGVANLGTKPTFSGSRFAVEVHLFDFSEDIYGEPMAVHFVEWIREERTFPNADVLVQQMNVDVRKAQQVLRETRLSAP